MSNDRMNTPPGARASGDSGVTDTVGGDSDAVREGPQGPPAVPGWLSVLLISGSVLAAWRLRATPLAVPSAVCAGLSAACFLGGRALGSAAGGSPPRWTTALQHVFSALGGYFLFVSFALP